MAFLNRMLDPPSYGYSRNGELYVPSKREIWREFLHRLNPMDRKNWLAILICSSTVFLLAIYAVFLVRFFSWPLFTISIVYSLFVLGSHANFWIHRYSTHRAFRFRNSLSRLIARNLVIKVAPEETHVVSHHVHHSCSEMPGDPYNPHGGWLYCFLGDVNHQAISRDLTEEEYARLTHLVDHTGIRMNSYAQFRKWGSLCHPFFSIAHYLLNWAFWFAVLFAIGGLPLVAAIFGATGVWAMLYRTFNYAAHAGGKDRQRDGIDFHHEDLSVNNVWSGYISGEWHNNHHLYPSSARSGFLPYQLDLPWLLIRLLASLGMITSYRDSKAIFLQRQWLPYLEGKHQVRDSVRTVSTIL